MPFVIESSSLPTIPHTETYQYPVSVDILTAISSDKSQEIIPKLTISGTEYGITRYDFNKSENGVGTECSFTLWNFDDRQYFTNSANIKFEIGIKKAGVTTWKTIADNQRINSTSLSFELEQNICSFTTIDDLSTNLNKSPSETLVMFNPDNSPFNANEIEPLRDNAGNEYGVESISSTSLSLYEILDEIIVTRCGFSAYWTNIPDFEVKQISFEIGKPYFEAIKPLLGMYNPVFEIVGTTLEIRDATLALASSAPVPTDLTYHGCQRFVLNSDETQADAVRLSFTAPEWDYITDRIGVDSESYIEDTTNDVVLTNIVQNIWEFRSNLSPDVIQREELQAELRETYRGTTRENYKTFSKYFDKYGRLTLTVHREGELVPDLADEGQFIFKENSYTTNEAIEYAQHPFNPNAQYQKAISRTSKGLVTEDTDNPYAWNRQGTSKFNQPYKHADRSGNLALGQTYVENQPIKRTVDSFKPDRNGLVNHRFEHYDAVRRLRLDTSDVDRTGDVSLNGTFGKAQELIILPTDVSTKGNGTFLEFSVGDLPVRYAIPLARRVLFKAVNAPYSVNLSIIGVNLAVRKGMPFAVKDQAGNLEGIFLIEGYSGSGEVQQTKDGVVMTHSMQVFGTQIPTVSDANVDNYALQIGSNSTLTFTREIVCYDGYELTATTVADLTVEARIGAGAWTNIETGALNLDSYAGTTQTVQIRLTSATVAGNTSRNFILTVAPA